MMVHIVRLFAFGLKRNLCPCQAIRIIQERYIMNDMSAARFAQGLLAIVVVAANALVIHLSMV
jgi:hypothetical protein